MPNVVEPWRMTWHGLAGKEVDDLLGVTKTPDWRQDWEAGLGAIRERLKWEEDYRAAPIKYCPICSESFKAMEHSGQVCFKCAKQRRLIDEVLDGEAQQAEKYGKRLSAGNDNSRSFSFPGSLSYDRFLPEVL